MIKSWQKILGVGILLLFLLMVTNMAYADDVSDFVTGVTKSSQTDTTSTKATLSPLKPITTTLANDNTSNVSTVPNPTIVTPAYPSTKITVNSMPNVPAAGTNPLQSSGDIITQATSIPQVTTAAPVTAPTTVTPQSEGVLNIVDTLFGNFMSGIANGFVQLLGGKDIYQLVYGFSGLGNLENGLTNAVTPAMTWNFFYTPDYNKIVLPINHGLRGIAWSIALAMLYLTSIKMARSSANSQRRTSAYTMIEDWIIGAILIGASLILIGVLFQILNLSLAALKPSHVINFLGTNTNENILGTAVSGVGRFLLSPLFVLALAGITIALNFIYLQRYFTLIILICMAPIFNVMYLNEKTRPVCVYYWKELIGNIFMPVFHAFFLLIYSLMATNSAIGIIPQLMFLIMMIPASNMIRGLFGLAGTGKGLGENLLMGVGLGATMGLMKSFGNLGQALAGGGTDVGEAAMAGVILGGNGGGSRSGSRESQGSSSVGQATGGGYAGKMASRVSTMRRAGNVLGQVSGSVGGAVFGAATGGGNMTMMMSAMGGNRLGGAIGRSIGGTATVAPMTDGLSSGSKIELGKANASSLISQGMQGTPFVGGGTVNRANGATGQAAQAVMGEVSGNANRPWESGDRMEKVSTGTGSAIYQRKTTGADAAGNAQYGDRRLVDFSPQGHVSGSDNTPMLEQALYSGDNSRILKPNDVYSGVSKNAPRGPRGSAIINDLARKR
ncbi:MAG TPA: hypothetical protein VIM51_05315 [Desulfosporosinus sp.]